MKKIDLVLTIVTLAAAVMFGLYGCGQQSSTTTTTTTLPSGSTGVISGSLNTGVVRTSALRTSASGPRSLASVGSPIADYTVVAVGTVDKKIYFPDSKTATADGAFSITVPSGESFYLELIDASKKFVAPVSFASTTGGVVMAVSPEAGGAAIDLGKVVYESAKGVAVPSLEVSASLLDSGSTATKSSSGDFVPVGAGILGRGTGEAAFSGTLKDKVDEDGDGLPDVVDIDDDGDGKVDGLDADPRKAGAVEVSITGVNNTNAFSNLPQQYENYPSYNNDNSFNTTPINVATQTNLAIEVVMSGGTSPSDFSSIKVVEGPAWIDTATISSDGPVGDIGDLWQDKSYTLYSSSDRWTVHVTPNGTPEAGDVLKFKVVRTDGTSQEFISTLTFVFEDIPRLVGYVDAGGTKEGATDLKLSVYSSNGNKFNYTGSNLTFRFTAPKDDLGNYLTGMQYYLDGITYYNSSGTVLSSAGSALSVTPTVETNATFGFINIISFTPTTETFSYFKVDVKAQSPTNGGGNASQMINFKKN
jgi:hypothetical protein